MAKTKQVVVFTALHYNMKRHRLFYQIFKDKHIRQSIFAYQQKILMRYFLRWYEKMPYSDREKLFSDEESEKEILSQI